MATREFEVGPATGGRGRCAYQLRSFASRSATGHRHSPRYLPQRSFIALLAILAVSAPAYTQQTAISSQPATGAPAVSTSQLPVDHSANVSFSASRTPGFQVGIEEKLDRAFAIALDHLQDHDSCQALFTDLGADGFTMMGAVLYMQASQKYEMQVCRRSVVAFTSVGRLGTNLCRKFARLADEKAAVVLLHEALHSAGLDEYPHAPRAMNPAEIDAMVIRSCGFSHK